MGRRDVVVTLKTSDLKAARQRRHAALAKIQATFAAAANGAPQGAPGSILQSAQALREELIAGRLDR
jgi:hypothetical protein